MGDNPRPQPPVVLVVGPDRFPEVLAVVRAGFETVRAEFGITRENNPNYPAFWTLGDVSRAVARPALALGVETDQGLSGCAFLGPSLRRAGCWELRHLAVLPDQRHLGLGGRLVKAAASQAAAYGATALRIGIIAENRRLADWYHSLGFEDVSCAEVYPGLPFTVDHLELGLSEIDKSIKL